MATVLIHAGMPKTGSTAIRKYLRRNCCELAQSGVTLAVAVPSVHGPGVAVVPSEGDANINSSQLIRHLREHPEAKLAIMGVLIQELDRLARDSETVLLTAETLAYSLAHADLDVLGPLDELAARHAVRVAYYVRPQHSALEAAWRQWGFRTGQRPTAYIERQARQLDYSKTWATVRAAAPGIDFVVRPFRRDLLDRNDVVVDFAVRFLGVAAGTLAPSPDNQANVGLSLEIVNLLSCAPQLFFGPTPHDNERFEKTKLLLRDIEVPPSDNTHYGRQLLQGWCYERFEPSNRRLIEHFRWPTDSFIPPIGAAIDELRPLNLLWRSSASPMEVQAFLKLLDLQLAHDEPIQH